MGGPTQYSMGAFNNGKAMQNMGILQHLFYRYFLEIKHKKTYTGMGLTVPMMKEKTSMTLVM